MATLFAVLSVTHLSADTLEEHKSEKEEQPKYIISMKVEEVGTNGAENKVIASPVFECVEGKVAKLSIGSSNFDNSNQKSIEIEAKVNSKD